MQVVQVYMQDLNISDYIGQRDNMPQLHTKDGIIEITQNEYEILIKQTNPNYRDIIKELDELKAALREKGILP